MIKRYHITLGASTTAGGTVTSASSFISVDGAKIALEGDRVFCKACNADGVIALDGPRLSESFNGRQVALSDDLCICKCMPAPKLVNIQTHKVQHVDADWHAATAGAALEMVASLNASGSGGAEIPDGVPLVLLDPKTEEPCANRRYSLELRDKLIEGMTDRNGATRPLTAAERADVLRWHVDGIATA